MGGSRGAGAAGGDAAVWWCSRAVPQVNLLPAGVWCLVLADWQTRVYGKRVRVRVKAG
jgi:hypothetical protein